MKKLVLKLSVALAFASLTIISTFLLVSGRSDPYYLRFTSGTKKSLVIGTSRAAQGLNPSVINSDLGRNDVYNFSFTASHSPYGPVYFSAIKKKLDTLSDDQIFIITVDPWSICSKNIYPDSVELFRENSSFLATLNDYNSNPNFEYLVHHYPERYFNIFRNNQIELKDNGWLKVEIDMSQKEVKTRTSNWIEKYRQKELPYYNYSKVRMEFLQAIVNHMKKYGRVFLVRLPISTEMQKIEYELLPNFNELIFGVSNKCGVPYLDMISNQKNYQFTDGNHLYYKSGIEVSHELASWIQSKEY